MQLSPHFILAEKICFFIANILRCNELVKAQVMVNHDCMIASRTKQHNVQCAQTSEHAQELKMSGKFLIHHNKKDGGILIVKTVLCEFALAVCNDS